MAKVQTAPAAYILAMMPALAEAVVLVVLRAALVQLGQIITAVTLVVVAVAPKSTAKQEMAQVVQ
jgi:hypothetical protein